MVKVTEEELNKHKEKLRFEKSLLDIADSCPLNMLMNYGIPETDPKFLYYQKLIAAGRGDEVRQERSGWRRFCHFLFQ